MVGKKWDRWDKIVVVGFAVFLMACLWSMAYSEVPYPDKAGNSQSADKTVIRVVKGTAGMIAQGTPVCVTGEVELGGVIYATVEKADADNLSIGPCLGILAGNISDTLVADCVVVGRVERCNTGSYTAGDVLYLSATAGVMSTTAPTGLTARSQPVAIVMRADAKDGVLYAMAGGRPDAVPNAIVTDSGTFGQTTTITMNEHGEMVNSQQTFTLRANGNVDSDGDANWAGAVRGDVGAFRGFSTTDDGYVGGYLHSDNTFRWSWYYHAAPSGGTAVILSQSQMTAPVNIKAIEWRVGTGFATRTTVFQAYTGTPAKAIPGFAWKAFGQYGRTTLDYTIEPGVIYSFKNHTGSGTGGATGNYTLIYTY